MPRKNEHVPTKAQRDTVTLHAMVGTPQEDIARVLGISDRTLRKHYRDELDLSLAKANATIGGSLFNKAKGGDTSAQMFWLKTRAGFREKQEEKPQGESLTDTVNKLIDKLPN
jgi:predicted transcriptional regulator